MKRPYVICHMCTTIDGKVLVDRWGQLPGQKSGASLFERTAATFKIPAWLVGTTTMREFMGRNVALAKAAEPVPSGDFIADAKTKSFAIGVDAHGKLRFQSSEIEGDHTVILTTSDVGDAYLAHLRRAGVSYLLCGKGDVNLAVALEKVSTAFKLKKVMLQGGGTFNGAMLAAGHVDEISQVIVPVVDGGGPTVTGVFDTPGEPGKNAVGKLKPISRKTLPGGAIWLRYRVSSTRNTK